MFVLKDISDDLLLKVGRHGDIDYFNVRVLQEGFIGLVDVWDLVPFGDCCSVRRWPRDGSLPAGKQRDGSLP